ncbi:MAG: TlpA disulfide reductase family protein [Gammaproteobacteria bacterium]|nr:TlpA disulfide reductase family protein [Gammaproteobacteria bacterium]
MSFRKTKLLSVLLAVFAGLTINSAVAQVEVCQWRIVNYWSEWCAPCRIEIPMLNALNARFAGSNVSVVGINFEEDPRDQTLEIAAELEIEFPVLTKQQVIELGLRPPDVLPTTYILSPTNEVVAKLIGMQTEQQLHDQLQILGVPLTKH